MQGKSCFSAIAGPGGTEKCFLHTAFAGVPYATEQGNLVAEQGNMAAMQRTLATASANWLEQTPTRPDSYATPDRRAN